LFLRSDVSKQNKEKIMTENTVSEATWNWTRSLSDTSKAFADSVVATQERNLRCGQSIFENGLEVLKSHTAGTRSLTHTLVEQSQKQQETFQGLTREAVEVYMSFFSTPFSYWLQMFKMAESMTWQGLGAAQKVVREGVDVTQAAMREGRR